MLKVELEPNPNRNPNPKVELERAALLLAALIRPPLPPSPPSPPPVPPVTPWAAVCSTLFAPLPFFETYRGYVAVSLSC